MDRVVSLLIVVAVLVAWLWLVPAGARSRRQSPLWGAFTATAAGYEPASETVKFAEGDTKDVVITLKAVSAAVDAINSAVDGTVQLLDKLRPSPPPKQE